MLQIHFSTILTDIKGDISLLWETDFNTLSQEKAFRGYDPTCPCVRYSWIREKKGNLSL